ncbi:hypothetical protein [Haladaptatus sp. W1]|uniref:hypothetical protein n=1 Tax=Haladaptatus sp. W1 TaxID=1897478 RepID=UPI0020C7A890|nr:hypothetical protein [Haladaptatus sp. W1]
MKGVNTHTSAMMSAIIASVPSERNGICSEMTPPPTRTPFIAPYCVWNIQRHIRPLMT